MKLNGLYCGAAAAVTLALTATTPQAAPLSGAGNELNDGSAIVQKAAYRRCWIRYGVRHCRWVDYFYDDDYPYYGYGPDIGFFFGGHGGHFHGGHFHGGHHH
jgi:hypothetical protein